MSAEDREGRPGGGPVVGAQTISRAFAVLRLFREHRGDLGVGMISKELGLNVSTTHRIVRALVSEGYLAQNEDSERYYLGTGALLLGQAAHRNFGLDVVYPVLQQVAASTGESVNLGVLSGDTAVVVERIESAKPLRFTQPPGTRVPLHASSMGKVLLAFNAETEQRMLRGVKRLEQLTPNTFGTPKELRSELERTRARGWSIDNEELTQGVRCVGAPICDGAGIARAAIAIQAPAVRVPDERFDELGPVAMRAAKEISALLPPGHTF
ncbi:IclR family transcriptional regulator [Prauserella sp. PE36]|uniref:IclR family transcriptional regulator n=1 Tax=Prauserella endophytica TaxID=1592324 RepID=A0ABY2SBJ0_9PSEU|nr:MULTISPECIES: IclR family transcriptional regulator [Prauserella]RBM14114.1 IclR family transcriptional regulator [Prauserella sp. PE36]TKG72841.1 IclR family transcriptional regulator [Prauserella endophytica]